MLVDAPVWFIETDGEDAKQYGALLLIQKTSRQQARTPKSAKLVGFAGYLKVEAVNGVYDEGCGCDWRRTRTTSRGVTGIWSVRG